jgi:glycosyltransferase involved in cell wall biosynthesis
MKSSPLITVLIPTYNHEDLLLFSVRSVLRQTVQEFEIFIIGDGATAKTCEVAATLAESDSRITLLEFPKSSRTGELYRHKVLKEQARGRYVAYLADDDLLLPHHFDVMIHELKHCDFIHPMPVFINEKGVLGVAEGDLGIDFVRKRLLQSSTFNFISLSGVMHTLDFYHTLPFGWRETPVGTPTDLYMWQQILQMSDCRARSSAKVTTLQFPSPGRKEWSISRRQEELASWEERLSKPDGRDYLTDLAMEYIRWSRTWYGYRIEELEQKLESIESDPAT